MDLSRSSGLPQPPTPDRSVHVLSPLPRVTHGSLGTTVRDVTSGRSDGEYPFIRSRHPDPSTQTSQSTLLGFPSPPLGVLGRDFGVQRPRQCLLRSSGPWAPVSKEVRGRQRDTTVKGVSNYFKFPFCPQRNVFGRSEGPRVNVSFSTDPTETPAGGVGEDDTTHVLHERSGVSCSPGVPGLLLGVRTARRERGKRSGHQSGHSEDSGPRVRENQWCVRRVRHLVPGKPEGPLQTVPVGANRLEVWGLRVTRVLPRGPRFVGGAGPGPQGRVVGDESEGRVLGGKVV